MLIEFIINNNIISHSLSPEYLRTLLTFDQGWVGPFVGYTTVGLIGAGALSCASLHAMGDTDERWDAIREELGSQMTTLRMEMLPQ